MNALAGPGAICVDVETDASGRVASLAVHSSRPAGLGQVFVGRLGEDAPALAGQLFSLCGFSHAAAARLAIFAARGEATVTADVFSVAVGLAAEEIAESLRSIALGWPSLEGSAEIARVAAPLREAMSAARLISTAAGRGEAHARRAELALAAERLSNASERLGLQSSAPQRPTPGSLFAARLAEAQAETFVEAQAPDALRPADAAAVAQALREGRDRFAAAPVLPDRVVETGAFARHWRETAENESALAARLAARFLAISEAIEAMRQALSTGEANAGERATALPLGAGEGFAAVDTARGRLYHWLRLDADERVLDYAMLAPTEWNFHPAGPFAAALRGAKVGAGYAARLRMRRLAAVFDPCVGFQVALREPADA